MLRRALVRRDSGPFRDTLRVRLAIVLVPFLVVVWWLHLTSTELYSPGNVVAIVLIVVGLFAAVQLTWFRGTLGPGAAFTFNLLVPTGTGLVLGTLSKGETLEGLAIGFLLGLLAALVVVWLGDDALLRRKPKVFISYRREDAEPEATGLYDRLVADHFGGHRVFLDRVSLPLGHDFRPRLTDVLRRCDLALVVIGPRWPELLRDREGTEDYVLVEVETALSLGIPVVPVLVGGAGLPATGDLPASIAVLPHLQSVALRDGTDFADDCASLAARLEELQKQHIRDSVKRVPQLRRTHRLGVAAFVLALVGPLIWTAVDDATYPSRALTGAQVSPDGRRVATAVEGELRTWDVERAAWSEVVGELDGPADVIRWSPDGRWLATGDGYTGAMRLWDAASMRVVRPLSGHQGLLDDIAWSPDSTRIATGDGDGVVRVWRIDAELPLVGKAVFSGLNPHVSVVAWAPGGPNTLAVGGWEPTVRLLRLQDGELRETDVFTGHRSFVGRVRWSPDGRRLVSADLELGLVFHGVADGRFTSSTDLGFQRGWNSIDDLGWSPDGAWLAVADGTKDVVRLWSAETGQAAPPLAVHPVGQIEASLAWSPDGKRVAVSNNTAVRVLSVPDGRLLAGTDHGQAEVAGEEVRLAGWSGVGDRIVWTSGRRVRITLFGVGTGERTELRPTSLAGWLLGG